MTTEKNTENPMDLEPGSKKHPRKQLIRCSIFLLLILLAISITIAVVLAFTVYKIREPTMYINSVRFKNLDLTKNLTVMTDVSVKNPNLLNFRFNSSTTSLIYRRQEVGVAFGPPGMVKARRSSRMNVTVEVITERLLKDAKFLDDVQGGSIGLQSCTLVGGRVKILGMFGRHVDVMMNCTVNVSIVDQGILDQHCTQRMWM